MVRQSARRDESLYLNAPFSQEIHDPAESGRTGFEESAIKVSRPMMQGQPVERAFQISIHQGGPAAIEPVQTTHACRAGRDGGGFLSQSIESASSNQAAQPVKGVSDRSLPSLIAKV